MNNFNEIFNILNQAGDKDYTALKKEIGATWLNTSSRFVYLLPDKKHVIKIANLLECNTTGTDTKLNKIQNKNEHIAWESYKDHDYISSILCPVIAHSEDDRFIIMPYCNRPMELSGVLKKFGYTESENRLYSLLSMYFGSTYYESINDLMKSSSWRYLNESPVIVGYGLVKPKMNYQYR